MSERDRGNRGLFDRHWAGILKLWLHIDRILDQNKWVESMFWGFITGNIIISENMSIRILFKHAVLAD